MVKIKHSRKCKKRKKKERTHSRKKFQKTQRTQKYYSNYKCYNCQKMGHIARNCPQVKDYISKGKNKRHHAHVVEDDELVQKKAREEYSSEEYLLISTLTRTITHGSDTWLVDSGASKHMNDHKSSLTNLVQ